MAASNNANKIDRTGKQSRTPWLVSGDIPKELVFCFFCKTDEYLDVDHSLHRITCSKLSGGCGKNYSSQKRGAKLGRPRKGN